jgi:hypothetical protein
MIFSDPVMKEFEVKTMKEHRKQSRQMVMKNIQSKLSDMSRMKKVSYKI